MGLVSGWRTARSQRAPRRVAAVVCSGMLLALAGSASARPEYPGYLQEAVGMPCVPSCVLCHTDPAGGAERRNIHYAPFWALAKAYEAAKDKSSVDASAFLQGDSDGDRKSDFDELKAGESPILPWPAPACVPEYGCNVRATPTQAESGVAARVWLLGTVALIALARLQRRRASERDP